MAARYKVECWNGGEGILLAFGGELNLLAVRWLEEALRTYCLHRTRAVAIDLRTVRRPDKDGVSRLLEIIQELRRQSKSVSLLGAPATAQDGPMMRLPADLLLPPPYRNS